MNFIQDYLDLFSYKRKGHMNKYMYMFRPEIYDDAIKQEAYYPFWMEKELIAQKGDYICDQLEEVTEVFEIGPGSHTPIIHKTIPFLKALERKAPFLKYTALDSNIEYAKKACSYVKEYFPSIQTEAIELDFLSPDPAALINLSHNSQGRRLIFAFGQSIFANNDDDDIKKFLRSISKVTIKNDYFLFSIDTNRNEIMLDSAYNREVVHDLLLNVMHYLKINLRLEKFNPEAFEFIFEWNEQESTVECYLRPTILQTIEIGNQKFDLNKTQKFHILNSRKLSLSCISQFLNQEKLVIRNHIYLNEKSENIVFILASEK